LPVWVPLALRVVTVVLAIDMLVWMWTGSRALKRIITQIEQIVVSYENGEITEREGMVALRFLLDKEGEKRDS